MAPSSSQYGPLGIRIRKSGVSGLSITKVTSFGKIGLLKILFFHKHHPFWEAGLRELLSSEREERYHFKS